VIRLLKNVLPGLIVVVSVFGFVMLLVIDGEPPLADLGYAFFFYVSVGAVIVLGLLLGIVHLVDLVRQRRTGASESEAP
jgi:hypothetical protein